jgi:hypothetical protein
MLESKFFGKLLPSNPEIRDVLNSIRKKYDLPEIEMGDDPLDTFLTEDVDLEEIHKDIEEQINEIDYLIPDQFKRLYQVYKSGETTITISDADNYPEEIQQAVIGYFQAMYKMFEPTFKELDKAIDLIVENTYYYLLTGEASPVGDHWFGGVFSSQMLEEPVVFAYASSAANIDEVIGIFRAEHRKLFGKQKKITQGQLNNADYLRMKYQKKSIKDMADHYILNHPSEFPKDPRSKEYKESKKKLEERIKKQIQRLDELFLYKIGDKKD